MCFDKQNKTQNLEPPKTQQPDQIKKPKKEKQNKELLGNPKIKSKPNKIILAPQRHPTTQITTRVVESITVSF